MKQYILVLVLAVLAAVFVPGCVTAPSSTVARYHIESEELSQQTPMVTAVPVVVETPPQPRMVWMKTNQGYVQAYEEKGQTYVIDGVGEMIPIPSGTGLDIVYVEPQDIRTMGQENRANFYALLRADQQNHRESMDWARYRLQKDEQEHQQELENRRQNLREQEQLVDNIQDLNQMRNQNVLLGTNTIPTPAQVQDRRIQQQEVKIPATVIRTSEERSVRMTTPSVSRPLATERRVERAEVVEQQRKPMVVPPKKRTSPPVVIRERVVTPRQSASVRPESQKMVVRPESGSQPRTRGER